MIIYLHIYYCIEQIQFGLYSKRSLVEYILYFLRIFSLLF